jgi:hypothetical protein
VDRQQLFHRQSLVLKKFGLGSDGSTDVSVSIESKHTLLTMHLAINGCSEEIQLWKPRQLREMTGRWAE